jgi:hypothetical protein
LVSCEYLKYCKTRYFILTQKDLKIN